MPFVAFVSIIVGIVLIATESISPAFLTLSLFAYIGFVIWKLVYRFVGPVKVKYDLNSPEGQYRFERLQALMDSLKDCSAIWQVNDVYANDSARRHGGATRSVRLTKLKIKRRKPFFLRTNVKSYYVKLKKEKLYILPDVIIIKSKYKIGAASLSDLNINIDSTHFVASSAPKDANILYYTWQYVNKDGTPDRRFSYNVQLPVCQYGVVDLKTAGGFHTRLYLSNIEKTQRFSDIATEMIAHAEESK